MSEQEQQKNINVNSVTETAQMHMKENKEMYIFAAVLAESPDRRDNLDKLLATLGRSNMLTNEFYVLYTMMYDNPRILLQEGFIKLWLQTNRAILSNKRDRINFSQYKLGDNDEYAEFITSTLDVYRECTRLSASKEQFETSLEMLKMEYTIKQSIEMLQTSAKILTEGVIVNRVQLAGFEDMKKYINQNLVQIDKIASGSPFEGHVVYDENLVEDDEETSLELITDFGIEAVDKPMGGISAGDMVGILAPPKGFKSRLSAYIVHRTLVAFGNSVAIMPIENGRKGFESLIRAAHFNYYHNRNVTDVKQMKQMNSDWIRKNKYPTPELKELEAASYLDLKTNQNYGRMVIISAQFDGATFVDQIDKAVRENNVKLVLVDYLQLVGGDDGLMKNQRVGNAYQSLLAYQKQGNKIASLVPGQIKQSKLDELAKNPDNLADAELRDAGGESAEVIRTPDANVLIFATMQEIKRGKLQLVGLPSRNFQGFDPVKLHAHAGVCSFYPVPDELW